MVWLPNVDGPGCLLAYVSRRLRSARSPPLVMLPYVTCAECAYVGSGTRRMGAAHLLCHPFCAHRRVWHSVLYTSLPLHCNTGGTYKGLCQHTPAARARPGKPIWTTATAKVNTIITNLGTVCCLPMSYILFSIILTLDHAVCPFAYMHTFICRSIYLQGVCGAKHPLMEF